jgi:exodeoxyribonuclease V gamma subunit
VQVDVAVAGVSLVGSVPDVVGDVVRSVTFSRVAPRHRLASWVRLLAVAASHPGRSFRAVAVGRGPRGRVAEVTVPPVDPDRAVTVLAVLMDLHRRGLCEPLPLYEETSEAWAAARRRDRSPDAAARRQWESTWDWAREDKDAEHVLAHDGVRPWAAVLDPTPAPGEAGPGWSEDEATRVGRLARRLWDDLLAVEQVAAR